VLCVLLLRGAQTPGELRGRTERMYHFEALDDVVSTLDRLAQRDPSLAVILPRQPGTKESRYMHLFAGEPVMDAPVASVAESPRSAGASGDRIARLEDEVAQLREEVAKVQGEWAAFRRQFE
jgi:uncharacterized protein YceH (UPF0502 family)